MTLRKSLLIFDILRKEDKNLTLTEISHLTGLNITTTHRLCSFLRENRYLSKDIATKQYSLGPIILSLASSLIQKDRLCNVSNYYMEKLCKEVQETVNMNILDGTDVVIVNRREADRSMVTQYKVGTRFPVYCTAGGKVLLSGKSQSEIEELLHKISLKRLTRFTITLKKKLIEQINEVKIRGFAFNDKELSEELRAIAAPIKSGYGEIIAALNIDAPVHRITSNELKGYIPKLVAVAKEISKEMGYYEK